MGTLTHGLAAGAVGTTLINASTYLDMAVRGRPPSSIPERDVDRLAQRAGVSLGADDERRSARRTGLGSLLGFGTGAAYGLLRPLAWAADAIPHLVYGAGVVLTFDALER